MKTFDQLWSELALKIAQGDSQSGTVKLVESGIHQIGKKILEEAGEVWLAAEYQGKPELALEISQLIYHLQVMALARGLTLEEIYNQL